MMIVEDNEDTLLLVLIAFLSGDLGFLSFVGWCEKVLQDVIYIPDQKP